MDVALRLAYDGRFSGYARQPAGGTVEDHVIEALRDEGYAEGSWRSGSRTDRGVCAVGNVAACTLQRPHLRGLLPATQARLPKGVWLTGAAMVPAGFDPRRAAWRQYTYLWPADPDGGDALGDMSGAAQAFVGSHDMRAFARMEPGRTPQRTVLSFSVSREGDWWHFTVRGQSFLWNQVRRMVDALLQVGSGRASEADIRDSLATGRAHGTFGLAPAAGLMLDRVAFDPEPEWDPAAGTLWGRRLEEAAQEAHVRARLTAALRDLARG